ncbi:MAG: VPLPA-CTERM sorting domain-containing protein [Pseudomonadota bacterium]
MKLHQLIPLSMLLIGSAQASSIADVDLGALAFDVQTESPESGPFSVANYTGTSTTEFGTVGWSSTAFGPLSDTFDIRSFNVGGAVGVPSFEHLHVGDFTVTFDVPVSSLLFIAQNDNFANVTGINLGITAADFGGATMQTGTSYNIDNVSFGSYVLFVFDAPVTSVTNMFVGVSDGFDMAFFANPLAEPASPVPVPGALPLMLAGIGGLAGLRRRKTAQ